MSNGCAEEMSHYDKLFFSIDFGCRHLFLTSPELFWKSNTSANLGVFSFLVFFGGESAVYIKQPNIKCINVIVSLDSELIHFHSTGLESVYLQHENCSTHQHHLEHHIFQKSVSAGCAHQC